MEERVVRFRPTTVLALLGITIGVFLVLELVWIARQVLNWVLIAVFLALAMNPAVNWFQNHGIRRRGLATGITAVLVLAGFALLGLLFIPTLVSEVNGFAQAVSVSTKPASLPPIWSVITSVPELTAPATASWATGLPGLWASVVMCWVRPPLHEVRVAVANRRRCVYDRAGSRYKTHLQRPAAPVVPS